MTYLDYTPLVCEKVRSEKEATKKRLRMYCQSKPAEPSWFRFYQISNPPKGRGEMQWFYIPCSFGDFVTAVFPYFCTFYFLLLKNSDFSAWNLFNFAEIMFILQVMFYSLNSQNAILRHISLLWCSVPKHRELPFIIAS